MDLSPGPSRAVTAMIAILPPPILAIVAPSPPPPAAPCSTAGTPLLPRRPARVPPRGSGTL
eukprot:9495910-Pyramimonas_sp.AAC.1